MDIWIAAFILSTIVIFLICYLIPQRGTSSRSKGGAGGTALNSIPKKNNFLSEEYITEEKPDWDETPEDEEAVYNDYVSPRVKGLRIAWKQFTNELDTFLGELEHAPRISDYHKNKYLELNKFLISTLADYKGIVSNEKIDGAREKLARAKRYFDASY
ncbi:MAG: hypothetical protein ACXQTP_07090 [Candidatus Methanofastidiosia archaeon]